MEQLRIFLSSSPLDGSLATALAQALRESGADVWQGEAQQQSGQLLDATAREIQLRPIFIVLLSKGAFASNWVRQECRWAYKLYQREPGRILLPVRAELFSPKDFQRHPLSGIIPACGDQRRPAIRPHRNHRAGVTLAAPRARQRTCASAGATRQ